MRKNVQLFVCALHTLAFFLLLPALVQWPEGTGPAISDRQAVAFMISGVRCGDKHTCDQGMPVCPEHPKWVAAARVQLIAKPHVSADANGHPLRGCNYIRSVYQAFRLESKAG